MKEGSKEARKEGRKKDALLVNTSTVSDTSSSLRDTIICF